MLVARNNGKRLKMGNTYGQRIRRARQTEGLTQADLAEKIGVAQPTIATWEANSPPAPPAQRIKLEEILGPLSKKKTTKSSSRDGNNDSAAETDVSSFGAWLREHRVESSLSVPELAKKAGISTVAIYNIEGGKIKNPQASTRSKLSQALGEIIPQEIISETEEEQDIQGLGSLIDFDPLDRNDWPQCNGVYVLYDVSERPIYVGKANKISGRLKDHEQKFWFKSPIVRYGSYIEVRDKLLRHQLEQVMIKFLKSNAVINKSSVEEFEE
jgi:transcriptional regulator with XRE-family HTH domain